MRTRRKAPYPGQEVLPTDALTCSARSRGSGLGWGGVVAHCRIPSTCSQECTVHPQDQRRRRAMVGFGLYLVRETGRRKAHRFDPDPPAPPKPGAIRLPLLIPPSPPATLQLPSAQNKRGLEALPSRSPHHGSGEEQGEAAAQNSLIRPAVIQGVITGPAGSSLQHGAPAERGFRSSRLKGR